MLPSNWKVRREIVVCRSPNQLFLEMGVQEVSCWKGVPFPRCRLWKIYSIRSIFHREFAEIRATHILRNQDEGFFVFHLQTWFPLRSVINQAEGILFFLFFSPRESNVKHWPRNCRQIHNHFLIKICFPTSLANFCHSPLPPWTTTIARLRAEEKIIFIPEKDEDEILAKRLGAKNRTRVSDNLGAKLKFGSVEWPRQWKKNFLTWPFGGCAGVSN